MDRLDLTSTSGYIVAAKVGRVVGRVECAMGNARDVADALSVKEGRLYRHRRIVPAEALEQIDCSSGVAALRLESEAIQTFL